MAEYRAKIQWKNAGNDFVYDTFDRTHQITYPGGIQHKASSAPEYLGKKELANPEEMLAATLASCHMLTFLAVCAKSRLHVTSYEDNPVATLDKNAEGKFAVTHIQLNPKASFQGKLRRQKNCKSFMPKHIEIASLQIHWLAKWQSSLRVKEIVLYQVLGMNFSFEFHHHGENTAYFSI